MARDPFDVVKLHFIRFAIIKDTSKSDKKISVTDWLTDWLTEWQTFEFLEQLLQLKMDYKTNIKTFMVLPALKFFTIFDTFQHKSIHCFTIISWLSSLNPQRN